MSSSTALENRPTSKPQVVQDAGEQPLVLYSRVRRPLAKLSFLRRSLALAELAMIAYNDQAEAQRAAAAIGFFEAQLLEHDGSQAFWFRSGHDVVVACRGTEPSEWNDLQADANATMAVLGTLGNVHSGVNREVDDLWPQLQQILRDSSRRIWFCGHSLGGAMATIAAYRCTTTGDLANPEELHTFGSPRVGCRRYVRHADMTHYRWVHNNDVVTRVPPFWMGYRHCGQEIYLDRDGRIRKLTGLWRSRDRWRGFVAGLMRWKFDLLADHSIKLYARHIAAAADQEEAEARATGKELADGDDLAIGHCDESGSSELPAPAAQVAAEAASASSTTSA
jgi:triacylglycerol lipase